MPPSDMATSCDLLESLGRQGIDLSQLDGMFGGASTGQLVQQARLRRHSPRRPPPRLLSP